MCTGPVGLAETNSRLIRWPASRSVWPYRSPATTMSRANAPAAAASSRMFRKPGPAISTDLMPGCRPSSSASADASSRDGTPTFLESCSASVDA